MSSGLDWNDSYKNPFGITAKSYYGNDLSSLVLDLNLESDPGTRFEYLNVNTQLLGMILENATGMSTSAYASLKLWKPMGAKNDAWWSLDEVNGQEKAFCGFSAGAWDLARFAQLILNDGSWNGRQLISRDYLKEALSPASHLTDKEGNSVGYYGLHWWIGEHDGMITYSMRGYKGQYVVILPEKDIVIVRLGHKSGPLGDDLMNPQDLNGLIKIGLELAANNYS